MKALSVRQPWAWAIIHAGKDIENRTRITRYRGPVAIHATRCTRGEYEDAAKTIKAICGATVPPWGVIRETFGVVIGVVDLWDAREGGHRPRSKWASDDVWWFLRGPKTCKPYTCKGARGYLFDIPDSAIK